MNLYEHCTLCPRACGVNRTRGERGFCGADDRLKVARAALHFWEEPCLSGKRGSGTVFFSHCNLRCCYCQNREISSGGFGKEISTERLAKIFLSLQAQGAHNINLVTPTQYYPHIIQALRLAKKQGLSLPIVCNSGGYECVKTLKELDGLIDIYLPDFKYYDERYALRYSAAPHYMEIAAATVEEMLRQTGTPQFDGEGMMQKGVIVRHLALPGLSDDSKRVVKFLDRTFGNRIIMSLMSQYTLPKDIAFPELSSPLARDDYDDLVEYAQLIGVENAYVQEEGCAEESFIPPFDLTGV
ncbi:MAG TPA: radical SAM protein [Ruminococcaceae bacterium]|nr:radical SAM protein [Oscillospiraceae bacterium]